VTWQLFMAFSLNDAQFLCYRKMFGCRHYLGCRLALSIVYSNESGKGTRKGCVDVSWWLVTAPYIKQSCCSATVFFLYDHHHHVITDHELCVQLIVAVNGAKSCAPVDCNVSAENGSLWQFTCCYFSRHRVCRLCVQVYKVEIAFGERNVVIFRCYREFVEFVEKVGS